MNKKKQQQQALVVPIVGRLGWTQAVKLNVLRKELEEKEKEEEKKGGLQ